MLDFYISKVDNDVYFYHNLISKEDFEIDRLHLNNKNIGICILIPLNPNNKQLYLF